MKSFANSLNRFSVPRLVVALAIFCAVLLFSCATGNVGEEQMLVEDDPQKPLDPDTGRRVTDVPPPPSAEDVGEASVDARIEAVDVRESSSWPDAGQAHDGLSVIVVALDADESAPDAPFPDLSQPPIDVPSGSTPVDVQLPLPPPDVVMTMDRGNSATEMPPFPDVPAPRDVPPPDLGATMTVDIPPAPPPDIVIIRDVPVQGQDVISWPYDVGQPDVRSMPIDIPPTPMPEICNDRDDNGNGQVDEIFECRIGRIGSICVTSCGANGYQVCGNTCRWNPVCQTFPEDCSDTIDNDCNGLVDCADPACSSAAHCRLTPVVDAGSTPTDTGPVIRDAGSPGVDVVSYPLDIGRTDGCHDIVVRLDPARLPRCAAGWVAILYDSEGHPHESLPNGTLTFTICGRLRGQLVLSARCGGSYLLDWPGTEGRPVREGGVLSITLDGQELADAESLICYDRWSPTPGLRPVIPLEPYYNARCP